MSATLLIACTLTFKASLSGLAKGGPPTPCLPVKLMTSGDLLLSSSTAGTHVLTTSECVSWCAANTAPCVRLLHPNLLLDNLSRTGQFK